MTENTDPYTVMVPYGPTSDDVIPVERAAVILRILRDEQPELLSALIGRAFTGSAPAAPVRRRNRQGGGG